jgi:hypothetical protein
MKNDNRLENSAESKAGSGSGLERNNNGCGSGRVQNETDPTNSNAENRLKERVPDFTESSHKLSIGARDFTTQQKTVSFHVDFQILGGGRVRRRYCQVQPRDHR